MQNFQEVCCRTHGMKNLHQNGFCVTFKEYNTPYWEIRLTTYNFVDGCSHHYRFCVTFFSLVNLNLPGAGNTKYVAYRKPHEAAQCNIQYQFSVNVCCGG